MIPGTSQLNEKRATASHEDLEESSWLLLDFFKLQKLQPAAAEGLVPVVVQNADTGEVLILAYANQEALQQSLDRGIAVFYSTSRKELWIKGATSGDYLDLVEVRINCEQNSLLFLVRPRAGGVCHTRDAEGKTRQSCYYRRLEKSGKLSPLTSQPLPWHDS